MKLKKLVSALVSGVMVLGTLAAVPVFAENNVAKIGETEYATLTEAIASLSTASGDTTITLLADAEYSFGARTNIGNANTSSITIDGNNHVLNLRGTNTDWSSIANAGGKLVFKNVTINKTEGGNGAWNNHAFNITSYVEFDKVTVNNAVTIHDGGKFTNTNFYEAGEYYTLYIPAVDQDVVIKNCNFEATNSGRGIKVIEQYVSEAEKAPVDITVTGSTFKTAKKAAILVTSTEGANIIASGINIEEVAADSTNLVWVDSDLPASYPKVLVTIDEEPVAPYLEEKGIGVACIGNSYYMTLADAVAAAESDDTVKLLSNASGNGVSIMAADAKNITIDLGGNTYTVSGGAVGSTNYETQGFHLEKGSTITIKNGTITSTADSGVLMLVQNYCNLTLEDVTLDGTKLQGSAPYTLSNNCGNTVLKGNTNVIAKTGGYAFDCYYWPSNGYTEGVTVTLGTDFTGKITGKIEMTDDGTDTANAASKQDISISGGTFTTNVSAYCADGFSPKLVNGVYVVNNVPAKVYIKFVPTTDKNVYDITLVGEKSEIINRLNSAELAFTKTGDKVAYEILEKENSGIVINGVAGKKDSYEFHFNGKDFGVGTTPDTANSIVIGHVKFAGYGSVNFKVDIEGTSKVNEVHTTTKIDNIVDTYVVGGSTSGNGELLVNGYVPYESDGTTNYGTIDTTFTVPTQDLTVNIAYNNKINNNAAAYQDMTVTISGGDLTTPIVKHLGSEGYTLTDNVYTVTVANELTQNVAYTVTVEGAGYRTARYTVNMTADKTLNFWNNVMDADTYVEADAGTPSKTNFLAGDIVKDNNINIYDLSAVVSYFGEGSTDVNSDKHLATANPGYAKYDLNRDGVIDSKDVAYVLVSWGK